MNRKTFAAIHLDHLRENIKILLNLSQNHPFFCPMVKANGYGHGAIEVVKEMESLGIKRVGVVLVEEGIELREAGVKLDILVFGFFDSKSIQLCMKYNLTPVISSFDFLKVLSSEKYKGKIHLKLDTGMNRLGFKDFEWKKLLQDVDALPNLKIEGIATHFLNTDDIFESDGFTSKQLKLFMDAEEIFKGKFQFSHCLNSAALIQNLSFKGARPGLSLYGYKPTLKNNLDVNLKPVMSVKSFITQIKEVKKDEVVSYGATWKAKEDSTIGIIAMGYADGLSRNLSNNCDVLINQKRTPLIGRICMDYCMVDLTQQRNEVEVGSEVVMWGYQGSTLLSLDDHAEKTNTISYEFMTRIGQRVPKVFFGGQNV